uniref:Annexin n=3 Tax=Schistosoma mansoni TaxID=6183 RepID=A0A5K4FAX9_SCHMA
MSGHGLNTILSIVRCIQNRPRYFAEKLIKATKNTEKDLKTIIRIIVTRCEVDMGQIKEEFLNLYGKSLKDCLKFDNGYNVNEESNQIIQSINHILLGGEARNCRSMLLKLIRE